MASKVWAVSPSRARAITSACAQRLMASKVWAVGFLFNFLKKHASAQRLMASKVWADTDYPEVTCITKYGAQRLMASKVWAGFVLNNPNSG